jgi:hypothetical protein
MAIINPMKDGISADFSVRDVFENMRIAGTVKEKAQNHSGEPLTVHYAVMYDGNRTELSRTERQVTFG